jgi:hypothetical protein
VPNEGRCRCCIYIEAPPLANWIWWFPTAQRSSNKRFPKSSSPCLQASLVIIQLLRWRSLQLRLLFHHIGLFRVKDHRPPRLGRQLLNGTPLRYRIVGNYNRRKMILTHLPRQVITILLGSLLIAPIAFGLRRTRSQQAGICCYQRFVVQVTLEKENNNIKRSFKEPYLT